MESMDKRMSFMMICDNDDADEFSTRIDVCVPRS